MKSHFKAEVAFLSTEDGGRQGYVEPKYRPHLEFDHIKGVKTTGQQFYLNKDKVYPGECAICDITLSLNNLTYWMGDTFKFYEGKKLIGTGRIIEVYTL